MEVSSSKLGIVVAAFLACAVAWGWPRVFPHRQRVTPPTSPIVAFQNELRQQVEQSNPYAPTVTATPAPPPARTALRISADPPISPPWAACPAVDTGFHDPELEAQPTPDCRRYSSPPQSGYVLIVVYTSAADARPHPTGPGVCVDDTPVALTAAAAY